MQQKLQAMLALQDEINQKVHPDWRQQQFAWYRAVWTECAEMLDHYGWKWWSNQQPDIPQLKLELVDIWHFGMSILLHENRSWSELAENIATRIGHTSRVTDLRGAIEQLATYSLTTQGFSVEHFAALMHATGMSFDELYRQYIGKNVLNSFRQDHGYKTGTYSKLWDGREDNEHLVDIVDSLDSEVGDFRAAIYDQLAERYVTTNP